MNETCKTNTNSPSPACGGGLRFGYLLYQLFIAAPLLVVATVLTALVTTIGSAFNAHFWGYWPGKLWSKLFCWLLFLPVKVEGRENIDKKTSYVFVANHQGAFDIFLMYGYIGRNFKWMMKRALRDAPLIGKACESAGHIFVDKRGPKAIQKTYDDARRVLRGGTSLIVFPEGARSFTGHMAEFRKGAFLLAQEVGLSIVPVTIDGSFCILPRQRGFNFVTWHPLRMTIHKPIPTEGRDMQELMDEAYRTIEQSLPQEYQGCIQNPDQ